MPDLRPALSARISDALKIAEMGEIARLESHPASGTKKLLTLARLEALYEMAYLRIFVSWESYLEEVFLRYMCGYTSPLGRPVLKPRDSFHTSLAKAQAALLGKSSFVLWHDPTKVASRAHKHFQTSTIETILQSNSAHLENLAAVRHRIAHSQKHARDKFDIATMTITGKRYQGGRPGKFLRDFDPSALPAVRWLERLASEFSSLATQIA